jgi:hypothetical protein
MVRIATGLLLILSSVSYAASGKPEFNIDFSCGWDGCYRPMEWTPVEIGVSSNLTEPFGGSLTLAAPQDMQNTLHVVHPFVLTPNVPLEVPLVTKLTFGAGKCTVVIRDGQGRTWSDQTIDLWDTSGQQRMLRVVRERDLLIGVAGQPAFNLLRLGEDTSSSSSQGHGKVYTAHKAYRRIPWDWTGFASLDLLVLCNPDWTQLRVEQLKAVCDWVSNGGTLLLVLGSHPLPADSPLAKLIPFIPGEPRARTISEQTLTQWWLDPASPETTTAWSLSPKPDAVVAQPAEASDGLFALGYAGFGRVAVLAFDPSQLDERQAGHSAAFWKTLLASCLAERPDALPGDVAAMPPYRRTIVIRDVPPEPNNESDYTYKTSVLQDAVNQIIQYQYDLKQMRPLSICWVILILALMAILLGPVDYLVLKRLDRLPLTWLTTTGWIVLFTVGAYYGVQALRGGRMQVRTVSVQDSIAGGEASWATHYLGIFAPRSDDYQLEGLAPRQWWSGLASHAGEMYATQGNLLSRQIYCHQLDGSNLPVSVPISIWTVQSLVSEAPSAETPFQAAVGRVEDTVTIELANTSRDPIRAGFIMFRDGYVEIPPTAPGQSRRQSESLRPFDPWDPGHRMMAGLPAYAPVGLSGVAMNAFLAPGCLARTLTMYDYVRQGAALVCVEFSSAAAPFPVQGRDHDAASLRWARQIVLPQNVQKEQSHD